MSLTFMHDLNQLYCQHVQGLQENVSGGGAQPLPAAPVVRPVTSQQEQQPVKPEHVQFDFVHDARRASFFAHLVYNAMHRVARSFDLVHVFMDELNRIHRREKRNHQLKQLSKLR